jgi:CyaY protein
MHMIALSEQDFRVRSDEALESARRALLPLADSEGFEVELQNGVLNLVFEAPSETKFVVSPNAPVRQIWVSAMARSYKLSWAPDLGAFALDGETLSQLLDRLTRTFLSSVGGLPEGSP